MSPIPRRKGDPQNPEIERTIQAFHSGTGWECWQVLGAHFTKVGRKSGYRFGVWAPSAESVEVFGAFESGTHWTARPMQREGDVWWHFEPGCKPGTLYKLKLLHEGVWHERSDPFAFASECGGGSASVTVAPDQHVWHDSQWMAERGWRQARDQPVSIYEIHLGSWRHKDGRSLSYREIAQPLVEHMRRTGFTHVQFLPLMEHP